MAEDEVIDGAAVAAKILSKMEPAKKQRIVHAIMHRAPEVADKIEEKLFDGAALGKLSSQAAKALAQSVNHHDLALTLNEVDQESRDNILANMSEHRRELVAQSLANKPHGDIADVRDAKKRIQEALDKVKSSEHSQVKTRILA